MEKVENPQSPLSLSLVGVSQIYFKMFPLIKSWGTIRLIPMVKNS